MLGPSLWDVWNSQGQMMSQEMVACIAVEALSILEKLHAKWYVHGDVKPENFLLGPPGTPHEKRLYLVDLGLGTIACATSRKVTDFSSCAQPHAGVRASVGRMWSMTSDQTYSGAGMFMRWWWICWISRRGILMLRVCTLDTWRITTTFGQGHGAVCQRARPPRSYRQPTRRPGVTCLHPAVPSQGPPALAGVPGGYTYMCTQIRFQLVCVWKTNLPCVQKHHVCHVANQTVTHQSWHPECARLPNDQPTAPQGDNKGFLVCKKKMATSPEMLCRYCPPAFRQFTEAVVNLKFDEDPKYAAYMALFEPLCGAPGPQRPIIVDSLPKVGQKRGREEADLDLATPKKKVRLGLPATQWITIYNAHRPMKQRYHYNVANGRVAQHVEKGNDDGLFISSVACCQELWALIMDAGTGFTAQVYELSTQFLPKEWIMEKWEEGYYITAMAGSTNGSSLVVLSKGTPYTQQSYKVSDSFPFKWINKKWKEGFYVTSMATSHTRWAVVMSRNAGFIDQVRRCVLCACCSAKGGGKGAF